MAASKSLEIILKARDEASKVMEKIGNNVDGVAVKAGALGAGMIAAGAGIDKGLDTATASAVAYGKEVINLQRMTGSTAAEASKMTAVFQRYGVEGKGVATITKVLATNINASAMSQEKQAQKTEVAKAKLQALQVEYQKTTGHERASIAAKIALARETYKNAAAAQDQSSALAKMGIAATDSNGKLRSTTDVLADVAEYYSKAKDKTAATALAAKVLGKNWQELLPVLAGGKDAINGITAAAEKNGAIYSDADLKKIKEYGKAQAENKAVTEAFKREIGLANLPLETFKTKMLGEIIVKLNDVNPKLVATGTGIAQVAAAGGKLGGGLLVNLAALKFAFPAAFAALAPGGAIAGWFAGIGSSVAGFFGALAAGTATVSAGVVALAATLGVGLGFAINALLQLIPGYQETWNRLFDFVVDGIPAAVGKAVKAVPGYFSKLWKDVHAGFDSFRASLTKSLDMKFVGTALVDGIKAGLKSAWSGLLSQFGALLKLLPVWAKNILGIRSPSTVFAALGAQVPAGLAVGILGGTGAVSNAVGTLTNAAIGAGGAGLAFAGGGSAGGFGGGQSVRVYLDGRELVRGVSSVSSSSSRSGAR